MERGWRQQLRSSSAVQGTTSPEHLIPPTKRTRTLDAILPIPTDVTTDSPRRDAPNENPMNETNLGKTLTVTPASSQSTCTPENLSTDPGSNESSIANLLMKEIGYCRSNSSTVTRKREDFISWDDYFMAIAALSALRSKDPDHATGACLVDASNRVIGTGYNGFPSGCSDDVLPWTHNSSRASTDVPWLHTKSPFAVHAEVNAILNKCAADCAGSRLYTKYFPCNECAKVIIQSRVSEVIYVHLQHGDTDDETCESTTDHCSSLRASRILLTMAGVRMRQYRPQHKQLKLHLWKDLNSTECDNARIIGQQQETAASAIQAARRQEATMKYADLLATEAAFDVASTAGALKRSGYLAWDDYFMSMAFLSAQRSKDPNTQVGACIVDANKRIVGLGYNGFPSGCPDDCLPWAREAESELHKKYMYVCHAEVNAILNKGSADVKGSTLYVALFPCHECSKIIIQAGIREVVYMSDRYHDTDSCRASRVLLHMAGVQLRKHVPSSPSITVHLDECD